MPKLVDNYVLCRKIGAGQFGQVLKGYDRTTNNDIAVKVIRRESLKGKFVELLENEIKVLKTVDNDNIIKLYDLKKTPNNFYLILQYCNEGDLQAYVKKKKHLTQDEAVEFLIEILHAFKTLVKNKIMHRDFKLANILLHDGIVKIADFGFAKLLTEEQFTKTVLGSPLNMAPEVIDGCAYDSKADIYSIGVCFYQMLFGKPPFNAANIIQLSKVIKKNQIEFPRSVNKISSLAESLIRKMLIPNPDKRIDWGQLFEHPITKSQEEDMQKLLTTTLGREGNPLSNMSKFYIKQNMVILHPNEILKKQDINNFAFEVVKTNNAKKEYKGEIIKRQPLIRNQKNNTKREQTANTQGNIEEKESKAEIMTKRFKANTRMLLNERNKFIFIVSIMNQIEERITRKNAPSVLGSISLELMKRVEQFVAAVREKNNVYGLDYWQEYLENTEFVTVSKYFTKEYDIVRYEFEEAQGMSEKATSPLNALIKGYVADIAEELKTKKPFEEVNRVNWIHLDHLLDYSQLDKIMQTQGKQQFNFKLYYLENGKITTEELVDKVIKKHKAL